MSALAISVLLALTAQGSFERGVEAYRGGDYAAAKYAWQATLAEPLDDLGRARVYFDLGNAYWRSQEPLPAIACYTAAVRLDPRHAEAWQNLELARAKANLPPADAGDLAATVQRLLASLRGAERRALLFGALVLWTVVLVFELRFGGRALRSLLVGASLLVAVAVVPWAFGHLVPERAAPMLVIASSAALRAEPLEARASIGELAALEEVERLDQLPGWVRIQRRDGTRGWVRADALFALRFSGGEGDGGAG